MMYLQNRTSGISNLRQLFLTLDPMNPRVRTADIVTNQELLTIKFGRRVANVLLQVFAL